MIQGLSGADLHTHTVYSDGRYTPESLVETCLERHLKAVAVTDHDAVEGIAPAMRAAEGTGLEVVAGIELGAPYGSGELHIVGLFIDWEQPGFAQALKKIRQGRRARVVEAVRRLGRLGLYVNLRKLVEEAEPAIPGRVHLARALQESGAVPTTKVAFQRYLGNGMPAHVPRLYPSYEEAIRIIHLAGGVAVYAHPLLSGEDGLIPAMAEAGLDAIEAQHPYHSPSVERRYRNFCERYGLLPGGGSDCHGHGQGTLATSKLSEEEFEALKRAAARYRPAAAEKE